MKSFTTLILVFVLLIVSFGCSVKSPKRDNIPLIKKSLLKLQQAVEQKNIAAIDSLLSGKIKKEKGSADSLLSFVYGPNGNFVFKQFGDYEIAYTKDKARIDCFVMDSTKSKNRPIVFYFRFENKLWRLSGFAPRQLKDSTATDSIN